MTKGRGRRGIERGKPRKDPQAGRNYIRNNLNLKGRGTRPADFRAPPRLHLRVRAPAKLLRASVGKALCGVVDAQQETLTFSAADLALAGRPGLQAIVLVYARSEQLDAPSVQFV